jgi:cobalamin biosynthesis protein CobD/CbiB
MLSVVAWVLAALAVVLGIYYLIPNVYHVFAEPDPMTMHVKHAIVFFVVALLLFFGGRFARNSQAAV